MDCNRKARRVELERGREMIEGNKEVINDYLTCCSLIHSHDDLVIACHPA